jgi:hypothetical protein
MIELSKNHQQNNILKTGSKNLNTENWKVYHPNGRHMFTCGEKKVNWYLDRNLAKIIGEFEIQFTFDPSGYGFEDNELFGRSARETKCVVTGVKNDLQRHHIVPYCYRTYFPKEFKSKNHHDVVLIHYKSHADYEREASKFKDEIARLYGVKTIKEYNMEYTTNLRNINTEYVMAFSTINSMLSAHGKLSQEQIIEKLEIISNAIDLPLNTLKTYNYIQLYKLKSILHKIRNENTDRFKKEHRIKYDHGYHVVNKLNSDEKLEEFIKLWRTHFIDTMKPKHMPIGWSIDFRVKTSYVEDN